MFVYRCRGLIELNLLISKRKKNTLSACLLVLLLLLLLVTNSPNSKPNTADVIITNITFKTQSQEVRIHDKRDGSDTELIPIS